MDNIIGSTVISSFLLLAMSFEVVYQWKNDL